MDTDSDTPTMRGSDDDFQETDKTTYEKAAQLIESEKGVEVDLEPDKIVLDKKQGTYQITKHLYVDKLLYNIFPMEYPITTEKGVAIIINIEYVRSRVDAENFTDFIQYDTKKSCDNSEVNCYLLNTKAKKISLNCQGVKPKSMNPHMSNMMLELTSINLPFGPYINITADKLLSDNFIRTVIGDKDFQEIQNSLTDENELRKEIQNSKYSKDNQNLMEELLDAPYENIAQIFKSLKYWVDFYGANWVTALLNPSKSQINNKIWNSAPDFTAKLCSENAYHEGNMTLLDAIIKAREYDKQQHSNTYNNNKKSNIETQINFSQEIYIQTQEIQENNDFKKRKVEKQGDNSEMDIDVDYKINEIDEEM
ncbi:24887_t:CDS:2, partial [Dentiscutata erythropus]